MTDIFGVVEDISLFAYVIRTLVVGIIVFVVGRFISKRTKNQLTAYDFVLAWIMGALTVAPLLDGTISFTYILVPLITLFAWNYIFNLISKKNRNISLFLNGKPVILIHNGKIIRKNMKKHFINVDLLMSQLRLKNIYDISEVKYTVLEPNGHFSVIKKEKNRPVTPKDLNKSVKKVELPLVIINDGKLFEENLQKLGINEEWLLENLKRFNVNDIKSVYIATIDNAKNLYVAKIQ
ncbi:DUF421 domain-containing protein [Clostridium sediminicola]|uniref:YetF domain-containing protein n=1 Tax=Clostridium sediminicola TaxID=3114879 RepID=UPI0031F22AF8